VARRAKDTRLAAWWKFMAAHALLVQRVGRDLAAATVLPLDSYNVLRFLHEAPGHRLRLSKLAIAVFLTRSGVTRLADRLEKQGLLRRDEHIQDRRGSCAVLTAQGWNELKRARAVFARTIVEHFGTHLRDQDAETLNTVLSRILMAGRGEERRSDSFRNSLHC
jgi:DNA-binding MarR family transcriptional regulator